MRPIDGQAGWALTHRESVALGLTVALACGLAAALGLVAPLDPGVSIDAFGRLLVAAHLACLLAVLPGVVGQWWRNHRLLHGGR